MEEANAMTRRLHAAMTGGYHEADILIYHPMETFWYHYIPDQNYTLAFFKGPFLKGKKAETLYEKLQLLMSGLMEKNMDFDLLHQDALENFTVEKGKIVNCLSGQCFSTLVLPMCEILPVKAAKLCESFLNAGGTVLALGEMPRMGFGETEDEELRNVMKRIREKSRFRFMKMDNPDDIFQKISECIPHPVEIMMGCKETINNHPVYQNYLIDPYVHNGEDITGVMFNRYCKDGERNTLFMNYGHKNEEIIVKVEANGEIPTLWDTLTGEVTDAQVIAFDGDYCVIKMELPYTHGIVLVTKNREHSGGIIDGTINKNA